MIRVGEEEIYLFDVFFKAFSKASFSPFKSTFFFAILNFSSGGFGVVGGWRPEKGIEVNLGISFKETEAGFSSSTFFKQDLQ